MESDRELDGGPRDQRGLPAWLTASPAELAGLAVLVSGALVATLLLWFDAAARPEPASLIPVGSQAADQVGAAVDAQGQAHGAAPGAERSVPDDAPVVDGEVVVHVSGAVERPGLVVLRTGARVGDAVTGAGGASSDAELGSLNLARVVTDGEQVHVPVRGETPRTAPADEPGVAGPSGRLDLNHASATELEALPGIGPAKASAILRHRQEHGPFTVPGDLRDVPGIGEATFQALADLVTVG